MLRYHESDRGRNLLLLEKYEGQLIFLREEMRNFANYPRGSVVTKVTRRVYQSKTKGLRKYANFYDNIDVDGKQFHVSKRAKPHSQEELRKKYGTYDPNDYRIPENLLGIRDKLRYKKYIEDSVRELEKLAKETRERLNFGKRRREKEITREIARNLGLKYEIGRRSMESCRENSMEKTMIARYGTKKQLSTAFESDAQRLFYLRAGKIIQTTQGDSVRSRAELLVAEILNTLEIPYIYEYYMPEAALSCDFLLQVGGRKYYMEILGMMDRKDYRERWENKLTAYREIGIELGKNLIVLDLTDRDYLDAGWLKTVFCGLAARKLPQGVIYGVENIQKARKIRRRTE